MFVKIIIGLLVLAILTAACFAIGATVLNKRVYPENTDTFDLGEISKGKALVVYQPSLSKATNEVAYSFAKGINDSGYEVLITTFGDHLSENIDHYCIIVLGGPVYGGQFPKTILDYASRLKGLEGKSIVVFSTASGAEDKSELESIKDMLIGYKDIKLSKFLSSERDESITKAYEIAKTVSNIHR